MSEEKTKIYLGDVLISGEDINIDAIPTAGSSNAVSSGGTYTAIQSAISSVYKYKGTKANYASLPSSGNVAGDVWNVEAAYGDYPAGTNWAWTGSGWDALGGEVDLSAYLTKTDASNTYLPLSGGTLTGNLTAPSFIKTGGTSSQFLKADGSVDSNAYFPLTGGTLTGQLTLPGAASAPDMNGGLNLVYNSTNKGHIGQSTLFGIYSTGNIVIRPNGASAGTAGSGSLEITSSGITAYEVITAEGFKKSSGTSSQFLKADGSVDSTSYATVSALSNKQDTLTFDTAPTANSTNPVTSGGLNTEFGKVSYVGDNLGTETYIDSGSVVTDLSGYATKAWVEAKGYLTTESDPGVYAWAKATTKPTYTASEVGALPNTTVIPTKLTQLTNDAGFIVGYTETDPVFAASPAYGITAADITKLRALPTFYSGTSAPASSLGNDGDIYLQTS